MEAILTDITTFVLRHHVQPALALAYPEFVLDKGESMMSLLFGRSDWLVASYILK